MNIKIPKNHPICVVEAIINRYGPNLTFEFGEYLHIGQSLKDIRNTFHVSGENLDSRYVEKIISNLSKGYELALHSRVEKTIGETLHIPMMDLEGELTIESIKLMEEIIPDNIFKDFIYYQSGSSYHIYSTQLISKTKWIQFMGRCLLLNLPDQKAIVDSRWVGHRLLAGYSSLRWSCNTGNYKIVPTRVTELNGRLL